jgi:hypothetical protein
MGFNEAWGALDSRFAEPGIVEGVLAYKKAAGKVAVSKGIVRLKEAIGNLHVRSLDFVLGDLVANTDAELDVSGLADGHYHLYAHPVLTGELTTGVELKVGGLVAAAGVAMDVARDAEDVVAAGVPEAGVAAGAFKMAAAVPDSDFYKGRSLKLATLKVVGGVLTAVDPIRAHRVR